MNIFLAAPPVATAHHPRPNGSRPALERLLRLGAAFAGVLLVGALAGCSAPSDDTAMPSGALPGGTANASVTPARGSGPASDTSQNPPGATSGVQPTRDEG